MSHPHPFNGPLSGTTRVSWYRKVKPIWILLKQETVSGSGIRWAICKPAPRSRQITTPAPHHSVFTGWMPFLPPNQQRQSIEGNEGVMSIVDLRMGYFSHVHKVYHYTIHCGSLQLLDTVIPRVAR